MALLCKVFTKVTTNLFLLHMPKLFPEIEKFVSKHIGKLYIMKYIHYVKTGKIEKFVSKRLVILVSCKIN